MRRLLSRGIALLDQPGFPGVLGCAVALGMGFSFVSPFLSIWGTQYIGMRPLVFGIYMTVVALSAVAVSTTLARWSDTHIARRTMLLLGAAGGVLGYTGYAFVRNPLILICIAASALAIASVCFSQLFAHVREVFGEPEGEVGGETRTIPVVENPEVATEVRSPRASPGVLVSVVRGCFSLAWTVGPAIGAWMKAAFGFHGLFLGAASLYALFFLGVVVFVPHHSRTVHARTAVRPPVWRELTRGDIFAVFTAFLLNFAAHAMNMMNLPLLMKNVLGGTDGNLGFAFCVGPVVEIPLMLWFGQLATRGHQLRLIRLGAVMTLLYFLALSVAQQPWHVYPIQALSGASFAIMTNVAIIFFQDLLPGQAGLATTIFANAGNVGNLVGYFCFGALLEASGHRGVSLIGAGLGAITLAIMVLYRPRPATTGAA
jgi:MFS transporter, SET family, sugar efflux transporter